jgi:hypothetical protein
MKFKIFVFLFECIPFFIVCLGIGINNIIGMGFTIPFITGVLFNMSYVIVNKILKQAKKDGLL